MYKFNMFITAVCVLFLIIVSITKFSIVIGSPCAYLSRNRRAITWCPITGARFELFVIGYPRDFHVNSARFNRFLQQCFLQFSKLRDSATDFFAQKKFLEDIFNSEICYRHD